MLGHRDLEIDDLLGMVKRHKWAILLPTLIFPLVGYALSFAFPKRFTSQTLVLVEAQKVPDTYVKPLITEQLSERLNTMQEQIFSRSRLQPIIETNGLFKSEVGRAPVEDLVDRLRKSIAITPVKTTTATRGLPGFYVSFTAESPQLARDVCTQITSLFIEENLKRTENQALDTTHFLQKQLDEAKAKLDEQDARLAQFKQRFIGQLPGQEEGNMRLLLTATAQLEAVTQLLNRTLQDKAYAESILAQQVSAWEASQAGTNPQTLELQLATLQNEMIKLEARYTADHPDVIKMRADIAQLKKKIDESMNLPKAATEKTQRASLSEPPQIQQLRNQIYTFVQTIKEKTREQERLQETTRLYQSRVQLSPLVEQQYKELTRDYEIAQSNYNDLLGKKTQSEISLDLIRRQQGEQFRLQDAANLPERPSFPDRRLFAGGGLALGLGIGAGLTLLFEFRDKSLRSERDILFYLELPTLAQVPILGAEAPVRHSFWKRGTKREAMAESQA